MDSHPEDVEEGKMSWSGNALDHVRGLWPKYLQGWGEGIEGRAGGNL